MIKYQLVKANIVADALSRSQHATEEEPGQTSEAGSHEGVLLLSSSSVEPQAEDLQKWKQAYQVDPKLKTMLLKLC